MPKLPKILAKNYTFYVYSDIYSPLSYHYIPQGTESENLIPT